jgi:phosphoesterase RecJ-like protein
METPLKDLNQAWHMIQQAQKITLLTHYMPDGDGISACAAFSHILTKQNKQVETIYPNEPEIYFRLQATPVHINSHTFKPELIIACDTANQERMYYPKEFFKIPIINIDHHISNTHYGTINLIAAQASSACEYLFDLLHTWAPSCIDPYVANCLLMGILFDSQVFFTQVTTAHTLLVAAQLVEKGADLFDLKKELLVTKNPQIIHLWGKVLSSTTIIPEKNVAFAVVRQKDLTALQLTTAALSGFSNFLWQISGIDISILFYETSDGKTKISLRSKETDVHTFASRFGGGGHRQAAGVLLSIPIDQAIKKLISAL